MSQYVSEFAEKWKCQSLSHVQHFATPCSHSGSSVHGILQARILEWVAIPFSRDQTWVSCIACRFFTIWATKAGDLGLIPGSGRSLAEGNSYPFQYSCLEKEFHGQRNLVGYSPWGCKESDMTEWLTQTDLAGMPSNPSFSLSDQGLLWIFICVLVGAWKVLVKIPLKILVRKQIWERLHSKENLQQRFWYVALPWKNE